MRILFALPYLPSRIRVRPYQIIRELARRHHVTVLATDSRRALQQVETCADLCQEIHVVPLRAWAAVYRCARGMLAGEPLQASVCHSSELHHRFRELLSDGSFDVVHVEHLRAGGLMRLIPSAQPALFDAVDSISLLLARTLRWSHSLRQRVLAAVELHRTRAYEARLLEWFDCTTVSSPDDERALRVLAPEAMIEVVPNGVDLEYFRPCSGARDKATLVFAGKMSYHANVTAALHFVRHIFPLVRARCPDVRLRIVGSDPPDALVALARDPAITLTGYVPDIREHILHANVSICPMTVKVGIQNKILEAMALGVPVVASRAGAIGLDAQAGRDLLTADSPEEFAAQVCRVLNEAGLATALAQAGRHYVEQHHRWERVAQRFDALYTQIRAQHRS